MKLDLPMVLLYAAIVGVGVWIYGLVTGNGPDAGNGAGNGSAPDTSTTTLNGGNDHYGGAATGFGGVVDWVQDYVPVPGFGLGSAAIDWFQDLGGHE